MAKKEKEDLVPYYRPGTTEPDMVPRSSVPGYVDPGTEENEPADDEVDEEASQPAKPAATKKAAARKK